MSYKISEKTYYNENVMQIQNIQCAFAENTKQILSAPVSGLAKYSQNKKIFTKQKKCKKKPVSGLARRAGSSLQPHLQSPETGQILFCMLC